MFENLSIGDYIGAATVILAALMTIAGVIVKLTPSKKDDEVYGKVKDVVDPVVDAVNDKNPKG